MFVNENTLIVCYVLLILLIAFSGLVIAWNNTKGNVEKLIEYERYRKWWHILGFAIRVGIVGIIYMHGSLIHTGIAVFISTVGWNIGINLINGLKWYYVGKTSTIDKLIRRIFNIK